MKKEQDDNISLHKECQVLSEACIKSKEKVDSVTNTSRYWYDQYIELEKQVTYSCVGVQVLLF